MDLEVARQESRQSLQPIAASFSTESALLQCFAITALHASFLYNRHRTKSVKQPYLHSGFAAGA